MDIIRGADDKPVSTMRLISVMKGMNLEKGTLYTGYPIIGASDHNYSLDAVLITPENGMILFDIVEESDISDRNEIRDGLYNAMVSRLIGVKGLTKRRGQLDFDLNVITYAPAWPEKSLEKDDETIIKDDDFVTFVRDTTSESNREKYGKILEAIQAITRLKSRPPRTVASPNSKGAILNELEKSISNLDNYQSKAVIETVMGIQRIRGLAGSGKTVILALKAAYLHSKFPDWKIGVTFYSRSLKNQFKDLITKFTIEHKNEEPDWEKVKIMQAWGSPSATGFYYEFCKTNGISFHSYDSAKAKYGRSDELLGQISQEAMQQLEQTKPLFDVILIDEAQDFSESFLQLCYSMLTSPDQNNPANRRLVYAYDELQKLNKLSLRSPKEIFGSEIDFGEDTNKPLQDVILRVCYRNTAPVLATAHSLGFGIYRVSEEENNLVTMFREKELWTDVGYRVVGGELELGKYVELTRTPETSPELLTTKVSINEIVQFQSFPKIDLQNQWIADEIEKNLTQDELDYKDIVVIHPNAYLAKSETASLRSLLAKKKINSHLAGVNTSPDDFFVDESIAFTSIYRAKGNEVAMVYIMHTNYCFEGFELIKRRNILFTALTRSKGWVRACGIGHSMDGLVKEFDKIKSNNYQLKFTYPTEAEMDHLNVIHRELTGKEKEKIEQGKSELKGLTEKLEKNEIKIQDLSKADLERLKKLLNDTE